MGEGKESLGPICTSHGSKISILKEVRGPICILYFPSSLVGCQGKM